MVRVEDCHAGVLGSNPGGPRIFSSWNNLNGGSRNSVAPKSASGSGIAGYTQLWLMSGSQEIKGGRV